MNTRNPQYTNDGRIDCEIEHPTHGWIPTTLDADDPETAELFQKVAAGDVAPAPTPDVDAVKAQQIRRINVAYQAELDHILEEYPYAERLTWDRQEQEARAWWSWHDPAGNNQTGPEPATPYLDALATGRGISLQELVQRVITKADAWIAASGAATGKRQHLEDRINAVKLEDYASAAEAVAAVEAVVWEGFE
ncbi:hypothetical protein [Chromohalobacter israelensis]|uniref:hypothetical protein n=1 Tax=Chromohalobacter israelensis TaxID=141390 RepID=UPI00265BC9A6|nr:hypothetical protein [Chromohalobacter salexigens]MDO0944665.1 hypothetical protein [Chromohalobacter salexigens]